jgi:hypothetical protein
MVTAGLAKLVDAVNQWAAVMYSPTIHATPLGRHRKAADIVPTSPKVATISESHWAGPVRAWVDTCQIDYSNIACASIVPKIPPAIWAIK